MNNKTKPELTVEDYRRLSLLLALGLDVWVKGLHIEAVRALGYIYNPCRHCAMGPNCDADLTKICAMVDDRNGCHHNLKLIDDAPPRNGN